MEEIREEMGGEWIGFLCVEGLMEGIGRKYDDGEGGEWLGWFSGK